MRKINRWIVEKYIRYMQERYVYQKNEREKVQFVLMSLLAEAEKMIFLSIIFVFLGRGMEFIICILVLVGSRRYIGGFHAKTIFGCVAVSFLYISLGIWMSEQLQLTNNLLNCVYLLSASLIYLWVPLKSKNRPASTSEQKLRMQLKAMMWLMIIRTGSMLLKVEELVVSILMIQQVEIVLKKYLTVREEVRNDERRKERDQSDLGRNG